MREDDGAAAAAGVADSAMPSGADIRWCERELFDPQASARARRLNRDAQGKPP